MRAIRLVVASLVCGLVFAGAVAVAQPAAREPIKPVDLNRYLGTWYEQGRYEQWFQRGCERVVVNYARQADGKIRVVNSCRQGSVDGPVQTAEATARAVEGSNNAKLKVSFFMPFEGDYWVLDHAPDYSWAIIGEGSGRYLWILTRAQRISDQKYRELTARAAQFGYDIGQLRRTAQ